MKCNLSLFKKRKSSVKQNRSLVNWIALEKVEQLEELNKLSETHIVLIFKHSTSCGISKMVLKRFEDSFDESAKKLKTFYLDLLNFRSISNQVATKYGVVHQSPQLLIIKNKTVVNHASHHSILDIELKNI
ncbi:MAG: bacillithiol system redox-active protein YtxJ [Tenacibaculum sp.]